MLHRNFIYLNDDQLHFTDVMSFEERFERFWKKYPKKVGKKPAYKKFIKIKDFKNLYNGLNLYCEKWKAEETPIQFIPNPETFINQERYYDEIIIVEKRKEIYKKIVDEKQQEKEAREKEKQAHQIKMDIIKIYNSYTPEFRKKIKDEAIDIVKKSNPNLIGSFFDSMVNITIRKIIFERFYN